MDATQILVKCSLNCAYKTFKDPTIILSQIVGYTAIQEQMLVERNNNQSEGDPCRGYT